MKDSAEKSPRLRKTVRAQVGAVVQVVGVDGVDFKVTNVNPGRRRLTLQPADPTVGVAEADLDPVARQPAPKPVKKAATIRTTEAADAE